MLDFSSFGEILATMEAGYDYRSRDRSHVSFADGKRGLSLYDLPILNAPEECRAVGFLLDHCTAGLDGETRNDALVCFEWDTVARFLRSDGTLYLKTVDSDGVPASFMPNALCIVETRDGSLPPLESADLNGTAVAVIQSDGLSEKYRYRILYYEKDV